MRVALLFILLLADYRFCDAQNLIINPDFEDNGQPLCTNWFDHCNNEITYACTGAADSCPQYVGAEILNTAPTSGGQWCMKLYSFTQSLTAYVKTLVTGQFKGVYELKLWYRCDTIGIGPQVYLSYRDSIHDTGDGAGNLPYSQTWQQFTYRDTIKTLSTTVSISLNATTGMFAPGRNVYYDQVEFKMLESWLDIKDTRQNAAVSLFPNPFSNQLTFSLADNERTTVSLYNFLGQQVLQQPFTNSTTINTAQLADGIYFYELMNTKGTLKTGKVVKQ